MPASPQSNSRGIMGNEVSVEFTNPQPPVVTFQELAIDEFFCLVGDHTCVFVKLSNDISPDQLNTINITNTKRMTWRCHTKATDVVKRLKLEAIRVSFA